MLSDLQPICLIGALLFSAVFAIAGVSKVRDILRARNWVATTGRVTESKVRSKQGRSSDTNTFESTPLVVYEYSVGGKNYRGTKINFAEKMTGDDIAPMLKKYPVGKVVQVYYNPTHPDEAVLERDLPIWLPLGIGAIILVLLGLGLGMPYVFDFASQWLAQIAPHAQNVSMGTILIGMGLFAALIALAMQNQVWMTRKWQTTTGKILDTSILMREQLDSIPNYPGELERLYNSQVVYSFTVDGQQYISDRVALGGTTRSSINNRPTGAVKATLNKYSVGQVVQVYYDPKDPSECAIERRANGMWLMLFVALVFFGLAAWILGVFQR